jgi:hypothetical protein
VSPAGCDVFILKPVIEELESLVALGRDDVRQYVETAGPAVSRHRASLQIRTPTLSLGHPAR